MKSSTLITGHKGFIGRNLCKHVESSGDRVYGLDAKDGDVFVQLKLVPWEDIRAVSYTHLTLPTKSIIKVQSLIQQS